MKTNEQYFLGTYSLPDYVLERYHNVKNIKMFEKIKVGDNVKCVLHLFDNEKMVLISQDQFDWLKNETEVIL